MVDTRQPSLARKDASARLPGFPSRGRGPAPGPGRWLFAAADGVMGGEQAPETNASTTSGPAPSSGASPGPTPDSAQQPSPTATDPIHRKPAPDTLASTGLCSSGAGPRSMPGEGQQANPQLADPAPASGGRQRGTAGQPDIDKALDGVFDPELPGITIRELGILRAVDAGPDTITVWITPTWSGCPALDEITRNIHKALEGFGRRIEVKQRLAPAWSSSWISASARAKLAQMNIVPPAGRSHGAQPVLAHRIINCPRCGHRQTRLVSECGSTACKALYSCPSCANVFEYFKDIGA